MTNRAAREGPRWIAALCAVFLMATQAEATPDRGDDCNECHAPKLTTNPANNGALNFGYVLVGQTSTKSISATNTGSSRNSTIKGDFPAAGGEFGPTIAQAYGPLTKNQSASRNYTYAPTGRGADTRQITITSHPGANYAQTSRVNLSGTGVAPVASVDTSLADAGYVRIGTSGAAWLTVNNTGDGNRSGVGAASNLSGTVPNGSGKFTGTGGSVSLADNGTRSVKYTFTPTGHGPESLTLPISFNNGKRDGTNKADLIDAVLKGTGVGPVFHSSVSPGSVMDFGMVEAGAQGLLTLEISNITTDPSTLSGLTLLSASLEGADAALFTLYGFPSPILLAKGASTSFPITFEAPASLGAKEALLTLVTDQGTPLGTPGETFSLRLSAAVIPVPEPSTLALLAAATVVGLAFALRRKHK